MAAHEERPRAPGSGATATEGRARAVTATVRLVKGKWRVVENLGGKRERHRTFGAGPEAKGLARQRAETLNAQARQRADELARSGGLTFGAYAERWLNDVITPHRKPRTAGYYRQVLEDHVLPVLGDLPLASVRRADVKALLARKRDGLGPYAVRNVVATLRAILYEAVQDELIDGNPAARPRRLLGRAGRNLRTAITALELAQVQRVLGVARATLRPQPAAAVWVLFLVGLRIGECVGLQPGDLAHLEDGYLVVRRTAAFREGQLLVHTTKNDQIETVDVPRRLAERLHALPAVASPWLFPAARDPQRPMNPSWFTRAIWRPVLARAEVPRVRVHDARHTYASVLLRAGVPIEYVSKQLRHGSVEITSRLYSHFRPGADRKWVDDVFEGRLRTDSALAPHLAVLESLTG